MTERLPRRSRHPRRRHRPGGRVGHPAVLEDVAARSGFAIAWAMILHGRLRPSTRTACPSGTRTWPPCRRRRGAPGRRRRPPVGRLPASVRPEQALLQLRKALGLFANLRPVAAEPALIASSPLRRDLVEGVDMLIVRELTGGLYFGRATGARDGRRQPRRATTRCCTREPEVERIARLAFELARGRRNRVTSVDKANVLAIQPVLAAVVDEVGRGVPGCRAGAPAGRFLRDAAHHLARHLRCHRHREHVRRHPVRRGLRAGRLAGHAALGLAGRATHRPRHPGRVRADPRLRAGHRGPGRRQPGGHHPVGGDDAALVVRPTRGGGAPSRPPSARRSRTASAPAT